jgi:hypothetical protein
MKNWREKGRMIRSKEKEKQAGRKTARGLPIALRR